MNLTLENILLIGSLLLGLSVLAGKTSFRLGVPTLILFVFLGMLAGSEGVGNINFDDPGVARFIGIVALNFILFSGGLETRWEVIKPVFRHGLVLSTLGVLLTALSVGVFVWAVTDFSFYEGLLLGSIVSSTDAAAVFSILRSKSLGLKKNIRATLELESGSNDPMAYFLTIAVMGLMMSKEHSALSVMPLFLKQVIIGGSVGLLTGRLGKEIINRIGLDYPGLYPVLVIALMFFTFSMTEFLGGNGFLAIYFSAVYLGNQYLMHKKTIMQVFDGLAWLMQIVLFLTLGLLVFPSHVIPVFGLGLLVSAFLMFVARPFSVFVCLIPFRLRLRTITFISWVGLRGAVPIVFATYPLLAGIEKSDMIFNLVFFIVFTSALIQGWSIPPIARLFRLDAPFEKKQRYPIEFEAMQGTETELIDLIVPYQSAIAGRPIVQLGLPRDSLIVLISRDENFLVPSGGTVLQETDTVLVLVNKDNLEKVRDIFSKLTKIEEK